MRPAEPDALADKINAVSRLTGTFTPVSYTHLTLPTSDLV